MTKAEHQAERPHFDATKLRKGDKVLAMVEVVADGIDSDGDVRVKYAFGVGASYFRPSELISYAPGYTPAEEPPKVGDTVTINGAREGEIKAIDGDAAWVAAGDRYITIYLSALQRAERA